MTSPVDDDPPESEEDRPASAAVVPSLSGQFSEDEPAGPPFLIGQFSENQPVPEAELPIRSKHIERFQKLSFLVIAGLVALVVLAALLTASLRPDAGPVASEIAKIAIPALIALLGTAITWAFKSS